MFIVHVHVHRTGIRRLIQRNSIEKKILLGTSLQTFDLSLNFKTLEL
jgi:hypothetical protein